MRKWVLAVGVILAPVAGWCAENRPIAAEPQMPIMRRVDERYRVRFSTTIPADTSVVLLSTMTWNNLTVPSGINFSPVIASSDVLTYGGRSYAELQCVSCAQKLFIDFNTTDISTNTSMYITQGQYWSPDDPVTHQGPIVIRSTAAATVTGHLWFERPR